MFIADAGNSVIREVNLSTQIITTVAGDGGWGYSGDDEPATSAELNGPCGVAVDGSGDIFIADTGNCLIREVSNGEITTVAGAYNDGNGGYGGDGGRATAHCCRIRQAWRSIVPTIFSSPMRIIT